MKAQEALEHPLRSLGRDPLRSLGRDSLRSLGRDPLRSLGCFRLYFLGRDLIRDCDFHLLGLDCCHPLHDSRPHLGERRLVFLCSCFLENGEIRGIAAVL